MTWDLQTDMKLQTQMKIANSYENCKHPRRNYTPKCENCNLILKLQTEMKIANWYEICKAILKFWCISLSILVIFTIVKTMSLRKLSFFLIVHTESIHKYVCRVYHQLLQYIAKLRQITIELCKSHLVTIETPRTHSLSQHWIVFAIVEKYIGIVTNINFKSHWK